MIKLFKIVEQLKYIILFKLCIVLLSINYLLNYIIQILMFNIYLIGLTFIKI